MDGVPNNPPQMNAAFLTSSSEGVNVTKKRDDGNQILHCDFLQCVGRRSAFPRDARCNETFGRLFGFLTPFGES